MDLNKIINGLTSSGIGGGLAGGVAGGALVSALGSKSGRKTAKTLLKVGGIAAVGGLAWKAYQNYQQSSAQPPNPASSATPQAPQPEQLQADWRGLEQKEFEAVTHQENDSAGILLLRSMISAAMADGQLSQIEQGQIFSKLETLGLSSEERGTLFDEMATPWSPADFSKVKDPVVAIEIYTAAVMTIDEACDAGQAHLKNLADALRLPAPLVTSLHAQANV